MKELLGDCNFYCKELKKKNTGGSQCSSLGVIFVEAFEKGRESFLVHFFAMTAPFLGELRRGGEVATFLFGVGAASLGD
jgi:hypothetical protein